MAEVRTLTNGQGIHFTYRNLRTERGMLKDLVWRKGYTTIALDIFGKFNPDGMIDVGANIGVVSIYFAGLKPSFPIFAYEPIPETFRILEENIEKNRLGHKITACECAVAIRRGVDKIRYSRARYDAPSFLNKEKGNPNVITVETDTLDDIIEEHKLKKAFVKIDCEGSEYNIIKSIETLQKIKYLLIEIHEQFLTKNQITEMTEKLGDSGMIYKLQYEMTKYKTKEFMLYRWRE